jgi:hypothetical protein
MISLGRVVVVAFVLGAAGSWCAWGATDTQGFTVTVEAGLAITAPADAVIIHDLSDDGQVFAAQRYTVASNAVLGAAVSFAVSQPFTHSLDSQYRRDVKLDLAIFEADPLALWSVTQASGQTDYEGGSSSAQVTASSLLAGNASFDLTVTFLSSSGSTLPAGDFATTVTATVTAN